MDNVNIELFKKDFDLKTIVDISTDEGTLKVSFNDGNLIIDAFHSQECCEQVYADFSIVDYCKERLVGMSINEFIIKAVSGMGFLLCFMKPYEAGEKVFIPCYNEQNGYYSSDLRLEVEFLGIKTIIDISDLVENHIEQP